MILKNGDFFKGSNLPVFRLICAPNLCVQVLLPSGAYSDTLVQAYIYYPVIPYKTLFFLKVHTHIDWHKKIKHGYHVKYLFCF